MNDSRLPLERSTKLIIVISLLAALVAQALVLELRAAVAFAFLGAWAGGRFKPILTRRAALATAYLLPVVFVVTRERFVEAEAVVFAALACGLMFSSGSPWRWSLPGRWALPLAFWAVLAACTWPLITLREADFYVTQLPLSSQWGATVAMGVMVGILWFDWLFAIYPEGGADGAAFDTDIVLPLALGWALAAVVGVYQMFGHITVLNPGLWATLERATGTLGDANVFAVVSAMWGPALAVILLRRKPRGTGLSLGAAGLSLSWLAVWGSGSRSSLPILLLGMLGLVVALYRSIPSNRLLWVAAFALPVAAVLAVGVTRGFSEQNAIFRIVAEFGEPQLSMRWMRGVAADLWTRNGYGTVADVMIRQFPFVGVGLSAFYYLASTFSHGITDPALPFDNAQNWYRHELAELGIVGSLGWIAWTVTFAVVLMTARARRGSEMGAVVLRLVLVGFGVISFVGMPGQSLVVALTFWTLAFWFLRDVETPPSASLRGSSPPALAWIGLWLVVVGHTAGTAYVGWAALRPPVRAQRADLDYSLGFYLPEGQGNQAFRWAKQRAVVVLPAPKQWMELTVKVNETDLERTPTDAKVWVDGVLIEKTRLRTTDPVTRYVRVADGRRIRIETWVSRVHPNDEGANDRRERGMLVRWNFVDTPPPDAAIGGEG